MNTTFVFWATGKLCKNVYAQLADFPRQEITSKNLIIYDMRSYQRKTTKIQAHKILFLKLSEELEKRQHQPLPAVFRHHDQGNKENYNIS